jgi:hypothetical protein
MTHFPGPPAARPPLPPDTAALRSAARSAAGQARNGRTPEAVYSGMVGRTLCAVTLAATLALAACGEPAGGRVLYQGDYPHYETVADLVAKSDLVIEATVTNPRSGVLYPTGEEPRPETGVVITIWSATVSQVHKGAAAATLEVQQTGGERDGVTYEQPGAVPFVAGRTYLLFLATFPDAPAALLNPGQAQHTVEADGTYRPVGDNTLRVTAADLTRAATPPAPARPRPAAPRPARSCAS